MNGFPARLVFALALVLPHAEVSLASPPAPKVRPKSALPGLPPPGAPGEVLDLGTGRTRALGPMGEVRTEFQATLLKENRVLVSGGGSASTEFLDGSTLLFNPGPALTQVRAGHRALALPDGRVLVLGGTEQPAPAEVLDAGGRSFQVLPGPRFGLFAEAVSLKEGVLLLDGASGACWIWDGKGTPRATASMQPRLCFATALLPDGRVLVSGGFPSVPERLNSMRKGFPARTSTSEEPGIEVFQPTKGRWSRWKAAALPRARHRAIPLPDGRILLVGGFGPDGTQAVEVREIVDSNRESLQRVPAGQDRGCPGWERIEQDALLLPEGGTALETLSGKPGGLRLANAYIAPQLVGLPGNRILVLGSPQWGPSVERWDPRTRQFSHLGSLRAGAEGLVFHRGRVLVLGPVVDSLDPKTGSLRTVGRREEVLRGVAQGGALPKPLTLPDFPDGEQRLEALVLSLDSGRSLVIGGSLNGKATDQAWILDLKKQRLQPTGALRTKRAFPGGARPGQGGLRLPDGTVLVWGGEGQGLR